MFERLKLFIADDPSWAAFAAAVFAMGFSLPLARAFIVISLILSAIPSLTKRDPFRRSLPATGWIVYLILAIAVTTVMAVVNTDPLIVPKTGLKKLPKLLWYITIPLTITQVNSTERFYTILKILIAGCLFSALSVIFLNPLYALLQVNWPAEITAPVNETEKMLIKWADRFRMTKGINSWVYKGYRAPDYIASLLKLGTMQDAQRLMVAFPASLCLFIDSKRDNLSGKLRIASLITTILLFCGLLLTFKRGPLFFSLFACGVILLKYLGTKGIVALSLGCILFMAHPALRQRLADLPDEFSTARGGRALMWTRIVPAVHKEYPFGIGFRALTNEKMRQHGPRVERRQNHVHSTPLQSFVDFGWLGVIAYIFWMGAALTATIRSLLKTRSKGFKQPSVRYVPLAMLSTLLLYGLIEYNLANADVVLLYSLSMGLGTFIFSKGQYSKNAAPLR